MTVHLVDQNGTELEVHECSDCAVWEASGVLALMQAHPTEVGVKYPSLCISAVAWRKLIVVDDSNTRVEMV